LQINLIDDKYVVPIFYTLLKYILDVSLRLLNAIGDSNIFKFMMYLVYNMLIYEIVIFSIQIIGYKYKKQYNCFYICL